MTMLLATVLTAALTGCADDDIAAAAGGLDATAAGEARRVKIVVEEQPWRNVGVDVSVTRAGETMTELKTNSARHWDFARTTAHDIAALAADATHWTNVDNKGLQFKSKTAVSGATLKGGSDGTTELTMTAGLSFSGVTATEGDVTIDANKGLMLNSSGICITLPELEKGQEVTVEFATTSDGQSRNIVPGGSVSSTAAITSTSTATHAKCKVTMTADGSPTFTVGTGTGGSAVYLYSITVSACVDEGFGLYSTRLGVNNSHVVWDPDILNWAGISNDFYLMLWPNNIIKSALTLNGSAVHSAPNYFTVTPGSSPYNTKFNSCTYMGTTFTQGFTLEYGASIKFNSGANGNKVKVTIVQSTSDDDTKNNQIKFDGEALNLTGKTSSADTDPWVCTVEEITNGRVYVIRNVSPKTDTDNPHVITRNDGGPGIFYVSVDLDFTAYSPYVANDELKSETHADGDYRDPNKVSDYGVTARDANSLTFMPHSDNRIDLLYGEDYTDNAGTVHLNFKHALGKLSIGTVTNDYGEPISLKQITLRGAKCTKATMSLNTGEWSDKTLTASDHEIVYQQAALEALFGSLSIPDKGSLVFPSYVNYQQIPGSTITFEYLFENSAGKQLKVTKALPIVQGVNTYINIRVDQNHAVVLE
jgi:hypothetical protein